MTQLKATTIVRQIAAGETMPTGFAKSISYAISKHCIYPHSYIQSLIEKTGSVDACLWLIEKSARLGVDPFDLMESLKFAHTR